MSMCEPARSIQLDVPLKSAGGMFNALHSWRRNGVAQSMARAGGGCFERTTDDSIVSFKCEMALINQLCLNDPRLFIKSAPGVLVEVRDDLPVVGGANKLPGVAHGAEA
jgi:hypothetical protein